MKRIITDDQIILIFNLIRKGMTQKQISQILNMTPYEVEKATTNIYISPELLPKLFTDNELEKLKSFGYPLHKMEVGKDKGAIHVHSLVKFLRRKARLKLRKKNERTVKIEHLYLEGWRVSAIAEEVGCSKTHIYRIINTYEKEKEIE